MSTKHWTDAHFCELRSQSNIYGLSKIVTVDKQIRLLVSSLNGELISFEYQKSADNRLTPLTREDILFSTSCQQGSGEIEVVSMDAFSQVARLSTIVGISYLKIGAQYEEKAASAYMTIYCLPGREHSLLFPNVSDTITHSHIQNLTLDFIPFRLTHQTIYSESGQHEVCFLLSGNDSKIHVYRQSTADLSFYLDIEATDKYFPEFSNIDGNVTQIEFRQLDETHRLTAHGVHRGLVTLSLVHIKKCVVEQVWTTELDSPITSLQLFTQHAYVSYPDVLTNLDKVPVNESESINLLITSAIDPAVVFCDVVKLGLSESHLLSQSNTHDVILCSCVTDIDFDGQNEILIGTYGQALLMYKFIQEKPQAVQQMTSTPHYSPVPVPVSESPLRPFLDSVNHDQADKDKAEHRRRHRSVAAALEKIDIFDRLERNEQCQSDECFQADGSLKDGQVSRLVRSQENLTMQSPKSVCFNTPETEATPEPILPPLDHMEYPGYRLTWVQRFSDPVMALTCDDIMGDGLMTLVLLTLKGLHILQPDMNETASLVLERLKLICDPGSVQP